MFLKLAYQWIYPSPITCGLIIFPISNLKFKPIGLFFALQFIFSAFVSVKPLVHRKCVNHTVQTVIPGGAEASTENATSLLAQICHPADSAHLPELSHHSSHLYAHTTCPHLT